jgi:DNA-binding transcriptional regulator YiaG
MTYLEAATALIYPFGPPGTKVPGATKPQTVSFLRTGLAAGIVLGTLALPAGVVLAGEPFTTESIVLVQRTLSVPAVPAPVSTEHVSAAMTLFRLRETAQVTWGEVAQALAVSRRTIHNWLAGAQIAPVHRARLDELVRLVEAVSSGEPATTHQRLMWPGPYGRTLLEEFALQYQSVGRAPLGRATVADQFEPDTDAPRVPPRTSPVHRTSLRPVAIRPEEP